MGNKKINALDLFSGAGGFSLGMEMAGINVLAAVEYDEKIAKTYKYNHPGTHMINNDIRNVAALINEGLKNQSELSIEEIFREKGCSVDVIFGGPPCQGFSMAGNRIRNQKLFFEDERNYLFLEFVRMVEKLKPKMFVIENVPGILSFDGGRVKDEINSLFIKLGYNIHAKVLSTEKFGVPQKRKRAIFIGNRLGIDSLTIFPEESHNETNFTTVWDAIGDLPSLKSGEGSGKLIYTKIPQTTYQQFMHRNTDNFLYNHISAIHKPETIKILKMIKPGQTMKNLPKEYHTKSVHSGAYGRMNPNEPAYTITTRLNTPSVGRITHPIDDRTITPREAARIQSYPDNYIFLGDITTIGIQIGNSVPPLLGQAIGKSIINMFKLSEFSNRDNHDKEIKLLHY